MDKKVLAAGGVGVVLLGGLLCLVAGGGGAWYYQHQQAVNQLMPSGEATVGARPATEMPSVLPAGLLPGTDTSLPWPMPGLTGSQCDDLSEGGPVRSDGCITAEIHCDETIVGHTRGGSMNFDTEFYEQGFCTPATTQHDGGDERVYLFRSPPGKHRLYFTLDTPCADLDVTAIRWNETGCPTLEDARGLGDCEMKRKDGTERERIDVPTMDEWTWLVVVEGEGDDEGAFALTAQCGPWR